MDYGTVHETFWTDRKVRAWPEDGRALAIYLLTGPHKATEGFYRLPLAYVAHDLQWDTGRAEAAFAAISDWASYDADAQVVFIHKRLKFHAPAGVKQVRGAVKSVERVHDTPLFWEFVAAAERYAPGLAAALRERYPDLTEIPLRKGIERVSRPGSDTPSNGEALHSGTTPTPTPTPTPPRSEPFREDVQRLCSLLAELILANDPKAKVEPESKRWRDACRLLLDRDGRSEADVERVMRWALQDEFWKTNVLSMPTLRKQFGRLVLRASNGSVPRSDDSFMAEFA